MEVPGPLLVIVHTSKMSARIEFNAHLSKLQSLFEQELTKNFSFESRFKAVLEKEEEMKVYKKETSTKLQDFADKLSEQEKRENCRIEEERNLKNKLKTVITQNEKLEHMLVTKENKISGINVWIKGLQQFQRDENHSKDIMTNVQVQNSQEIQKMYELDEREHESKDVNLTENSEKNHFYEKVNEDEVIPKTAVRQVGPHENYILTVSENKGVQVATDYDEINNSAKSLNKSDTQDEKFEIQDLIPDWNSEDEDEEVEILSETSVMAKLPPKLTENELYHKMSSLSDTLLRTEELDETMRRLGNCFGGEEDESDDEDSLTISDDEEVTTKESKYKSTKDTSISKVDETMHGSFTQPQVIDSTYKNETKSPNSSSKRKKTKSTKRKANQSAETDGKKKRKAAASCRQCSGQCSGFLATNCYDCAFCRDRPSMDGPNKLRKRCVQRTCTATL